MLRFSIKYFIQLPAAKYTQNPKVLPLATDKFTWNFLTERYLGHIASLRVYYSYKIAFKNKLKFLNNKVGATHKLSAHLMRNGKLLMWYKFFRTYYIQALRTNFLPYYDLNLEEFRFKTQDLSFFWPMYYFFNAIKDFDRVLLWRLFQVNPIFNYRFITRKKRGKRKQELKLNFIVRENRIFVSWRWLTVYLQGVGTDIKQPEKVLWALDNFMLQPPKVYALDILKFELYKVQLLRSQN